MNILSIGNSFSQDAQRYLHEIAAADGVKLNTFNLYIGGCSLSTHYRNMLTEDRAYTLEMNGRSTGFKVSLQEALLNRDWDVVTVQQVSSKSPYYESYQPYLNELVDCVRTCVPKAKILVHQTWAYEQDSQRLNVELGYADQKDMFRGLEDAYNRAAAEIQADGIIPSGAVFQEMIEKGAERLHRDTYHASLGLGRYALGLIWYATLTGRGVEDNTFAAFDEEVSFGQMILAKAAVSAVRERR